MRLRYLPNTPIHMMAAIDPGKHFCGASFWSVKKTTAELMWAKLVPTDQTIFMFCVSGIDNLHIVIEQPRNYRGSSATDSGVKALKDTIIRLNIEYPLCKKTYFYPDQWKGSVPKPIHNKRTLDALSIKEKTLFDTTDHNVIDAVGIGLFALGRVNRGGVANG